MTTQVTANNRSRRIGGAATLKTSPYFETAAPAPKSAGDREKRAASRPKKKRRNNPKLPAITDRATKIITRGATNNPDGENTVLIST